MASKLLTTLAGRLFESCEEEQAAFIAALSAEQSFPACLLWCDPERDPAELDLPRAELPIPGLTDWILPLEPGSHPGKHPLHEAGAFYSLDPSSVFAASALLTLDPGQCRRVLDMCAAPGGKSVFASLALRPDLLLSNEVVSKRLGILRHNLGRCGIANAFTQRLDPAEFAERAPAAFDLVITDAPCSGQSLLAKGIENPGCFHPNIVKGNAKRQRRILSASADCTRPGGHLLYSTCTFALDENEKSIAWLLKRRADLRPLEVPHLDPWRSPHAEFPAYRLYPQTGIGAGAFVCLLQVGEGESGQAEAELPSELFGYPVGG